MPSKNEKIARPYQVELLQQAIQKNSIVYLGTGAGKTFIATMLIKELSAGIFYEGKKTVFLVHRLPLATQQEKFIKDNTALTVRSFCGADNVDFWKLIMFRNSWKTKGVEASKPKGHNKEFIKNAWVSPFVSGFLPDPWCWDCWCCIDLVCSEVTVATFCPNVCYISNVSPLEERSKSWGSVRKEEGKRKIGWNRQ